METIGITLHNYCPIVASVFLDICPVLDPVKP